MLLDDTILRSSKYSPTTEIQVRSTSSPKPGFRNRRYTTVSKKLNEVGIIKNDLYEFDPDALGLGLRIITHVTTEYDEDYHEHVGNQLQEIEGGSHVYFTLGDTDFIFIAHLPASDHVEKRVEQYESIDGIVRTSSTLAIATAKEDQNPLRSYDLKTLQEFDLSKSE